jgi:hypothetical protein
MRGREGRVVRAVASWAVVALGSAASMSGCKSNEPPACQHPCDLAQTFGVEITGAEPAVAISVNDVCEGGETCSPGPGCRSATFTLRNGTSYAGGPDAADLVCRVTAVSASGARVERDVPAHFSPGSCCSGYEFSWGKTVSLSFAAVDASADPDALGSDADGAVEDRADADAR